jgi:hypothetical protein
VTEEGERAGEDEPQWRRDGRARAPAEQGRLKEVISADYDFLSTSALHLLRGVVVVVSGEWDDAIGAHAGRRN